MPDRDLALLEAAAHKAGKIALERVGNPGEVREKAGGVGPVSDADIAVDRMLHAELLGARPAYGWLSEESDDDPSRLDAERIFIVDPIDGTRAFLSGQDAWAISIALAEAGRVTAGVVHLPALGKTYAAAAGHGAQLNGTRIAASTRQALDGAEVLANGNQLASALWPGGLPSVSRHFRPSIAYRLCLVAEGRFDATFTFRDTSEWDLAAGDLIAREAGAIVSTREGAPLIYNRPRPLLPGMFAAGPALHAALMQRLRAEPAV